MYGGTGRDEITGGFDVDLMYGGPGADLIVARGGSADVVDCGPGRDTVIRDSRDRVRNCEVVRRS
jgi:Ca2+-binding RTX toxin-like protein